MYLIQSTTHSCIPLASLGCSCRLAPTIYAVSICLYSTYIYSSHALYIHNVLCMQGSKSNQVVNRSLTPCQSASLSLKTSRKDTENRSVYSYSTFVEPAVCEPKPKLGLTLKLEPGRIVQKCTWRHIEHNGGSPRDTLQGTICSQARLSQL